jgi:hypothetical protein
MDNGPTLAGFTSWIYTAMGIPLINLPTDSVFITYAYNVAIATVNTQLCWLSYCGAPIIYTLAVYNLAGDRLVNYAQDIYGAPLLPNPTANALPNPIGYFALQRQLFKTNDFNAGTVSAASDEGSSVSLATIESLKDITIGQLANLQTPWGRQYLSFASSIGELWGLS